MYNVDTSSVLLNYQHWTWIMNKLFKMGGLGPFKCAC